MKRTIGFVLKQKVIQTRTLFYELKSVVEKSGGKVLIDEASKQVLTDDPNLQFTSKEELVQRSHLIVVLGGDGTLLSIARRMKERSVPIFGVNMGTLGFLTEISPHESAKLLKKLLNEKGKIRGKPRQMMEMLQMRGKKCVSRSPFLNDIVLSNTKIARITGIRVSAAGEFLNSIRADGLIVSTPTGSTAYNLAAGGPILDPSLQALILTPICPHSLTQRPLVLCQDVPIELTLAKGYATASLTLDGQELFEVKEGDRIIIKPFVHHRIEMIEGERTFYNVLREKLSFGNSDYVSL